ncbi:Guanine nucleotide-binding protein alpha-17 subunit [Parelaphostrongylus tenuis]|uniref:Guanine nucleotide-binding protein alpha-17 subunit n=1 Tax=Parelaphostrongylus tenuis TaxID=148309 RepID=A0AAD5LZP6_PARTN|nr:Guanine nucleotide-binding protein alpha-17 subunit [Parelaphostrongylus tenuis]
MDNVLHIPLEDTNKEALYGSYTVLENCVAFQINQQYGVGFHRTTDKPGKKEKAIVLRVQEMGEESEPLTEEVSKAIQSLWSDPGVKKAYEMRSEYQLTDSAKYFLDSVARVSEPGYRPTEQDILYSRVATTGVQDSVIPQTSGKTEEKPDELDGVEVSPHPAYSLDVALPDYGPVTLKKHFLHGYCVEASD